MKVNNFLQNLNKKVHDLAKKGDRFHTCRKLTDPIYITPKSLQQTIPIHRIQKNGVFELEKKEKGDKLYDKAYIFTDINYTIQDEGEKKQTIFAMCKIFNSLGVPFKIVIANWNRNMKEVRETVLMKTKEGYEELIQSYNEIIEDRIVSGANGIEQIKYFILTCEKPDFESADAFFNTLEAQIKGAFMGIGSQLLPLDAVERLRTLHNFYRMGAESDFDFTWEDYGAMKRDWRNDICNMAIDEKPNRLLLDGGERHCAAVVATAFPNHSIDEGMMTEFSNIPHHSILALDVVPISQDLALEKLNKIYMNVEFSIQKQQELHNRYRAFSTDITYKKRKEKESIEDDLDLLTSMGQTLFYCGLSIVLQEDNESDLKNTIEMVKMLGKKYGMRMDVYSHKQLATLNTSLPLGVRQENDYMRSLFTNGLAALVPFHVQELSHPSGNYYGTNQVSKKVLVGDRKRLINGNGYIYGPSGSGKSFIVKEEMGQVLAKGDDDIIVVDPQDEYLDICQNLNGQIIRLSTSTANFINPLELPKEVDNIDAFIADKSEFIIGICTQAMYPDVFTSKHRSIVDNCITTIYLAEFDKEPEERKSPTLHTFRECLLNHPLNEAADLAVSMEVFTEGSLNIFSHQSNVDINNRLVVFGIQDLGDELKKMAMLVMIETIRSRITYNQKRKKATWVYIDEIHVLHEDNFSRRALEKLWKEVRKQGGLCTGITQNIIDSLNNKETRTTLANSEYIVLMKQSGVDRQDLNGVMEISENQMQYVVNAPPGTGLIKFGNSILTFDNRVPKDSYIYQMYNTNLHEQALDEKMI